MRLAEKFLIYEFNKDGKYSAPIDTDDLEYIFSEIYLAGKGRAAHQDYRY